MSDDDRDELNDHWHDEKRMAPGWWIFPGVVAGIIFVAVSAIFWPRFLAVYLTAIAVVCGIILLIAKRN